MKLVTVLIVCVTLLSGCFSMPVNQATISELQGGYSGKWQVVVKADCKWHGEFRTTDFSHIQDDSTTLAELERELFVGSESSGRSLQGKGDAVIYLPDGEGFHYVVVINKFQKKGALSAQIIGPSFKGIPVTTSAAYGSITLTAP